MRSFVSLFIYLVNFKDTENRSGIYFSHTLIAIKKKEEEVEETKTPLKLNEMH